MYVDDLNFVGTPYTYSRVMTLLTTQFKMKLLGKIVFCLGLQVAHLHDENTFLRQTIYTQNLLKMFHIDQVNPLSAPWWDEVEFLMISTVLARRLSYMISTNTSEP